MPIFTVFRHKVDIKTKSASANAAGQILPTWTASVAGQKCHYIQRTSTTSFRPTYAEQEEYIVYFPPSAVLDYGDRLYNLQDKYGNIVEAGPLEIDGIAFEPGFSGKIHHYEVKVKRVPEI